jgi:biotin carboxyl carrier protein
MEKSFNINGIEVKVSDYSLKEDKVSFVFEGKKYIYSLIHKNGPELILDDGQRFGAAVSSPNRDGESMVMAEACEAVVSEAGKRLKKTHGHAGGLSSPMPGKIFKILKPVGSSVEKGETILILEAMKMEHSIRSDTDGKVKKIHYQEGELVQGGVVLVELE